MRARHRRREAVRDFCELAVLSTSNRVDLLQVDAREGRYLEIVKRYEREEVECFPRMLGFLVESLRVATRMRWVVGPLSRPSSGQSFQRLRRDTAGNGFSRIFRRQLTGLAGP